MITFPVTPPPSPGPRAVTWNQLSVTAESRSPFTLRRQIFAWPGQQLGAVVEMPIMRRADALKWQAFFASLRGREGKFFFGDAARFCKLDTVLGMPQTVGVSQGRTVLTDSWIPNTPVISAGDWLQIGGKLRKALTDAVSDSTGAATLEVWPDAQGVADGVEIIYREPRGVFRLSQDPPEFVWRTDGYQEGFTFTIEEVTS